jgi:hypothetical protein
LKGRNHTEDTGVKGRVICKMVSREVGVEGVDWVNPAQDREKHCLIDKYSSVILLLYAEIKIKNVLILSSECVVQKITMAGQYIIADCNTNLKLTCNFKM